jgi:LmbE family N-acetylglucosaminyl deacetylase
MRAVALSVAGMLMFSPTEVATTQSASTAGVAKTLVLVAAHADDEGPVAPILARYAREGVHVYQIIASDGIAGAGQQGHIPRPEITVQGEELVKQRADEARCAAKELGIEPPILLGFPDGKLGDYAGDRSLIYRLTQRIGEELARLRPDAVLTWGPDGGTGHPDHRIVGNIVTQLQRAGAPGVPDRVFYMYLTAEGMHAMNPQRGAPPFTIPQAKYFTVRVPFAPEDLEAARRSMPCHRSQFTPEVVARVFPASAKAWNGAISLVPAFDGASPTDLFH